MVENYGTDSGFDEKSCGIVVYRENKEEREYLILHYPGGHFEFPKGHMEKGETEHETAMRELVEETTIKDLKFIDGFKEKISYTYKKSDGNLSNKQVIFFLGKTEAEGIKISHEHYDFFWLPYIEAYNKVTFENAKNLLKKAENFLNR